MSKKCLTQNGNPALNNLALYNHIRDFDFKSPEFGNHKKRNRAGSKAAIKAVCFVLATFRNNVTGQCNPDMRTIAEKSCVSLDTVRRTLDDLERRGFIIKINHGLIGSRERNHYYFTCDIERLREMFEYENCEIEKTSEYEYVEEVISHYDRYLNKVSCCLN